MCNFILGGKFMKLRYKLLSLCIVITAIFSFAGCNRKSSNENNSTGGNYTLTVWGAEEDQEMLKEMCNAYAKANNQNKYTFYFGVLGEGEAADKILNDVQSGPDVYSFPSDQINKLYAGGALARVGGDIEADIKAINTPESVSAASLQIDGETQMYAYPSTGDNCLFLYYDKSVYKNPDDIKSFDSILNIAKKAGKKVHFRLNDDGWYLTTFFFAEPELKYDVKYNNQMVEQKVDINFDNTLGLEVMKSLRNYLWNDALVAQTDDSKVIAAFTEKNGKREAAAAISGTWNASTIKKLLGDNMGVAKLPTVKIGNNDRQLSGYMGYKLIGVNGYSKNKGEAHKLAKWLTNEENQLKRFETRGFAPTNKKLTELNSVRQNEVISAVLDQAQYNRAQKSVPSTYWTPMASLITPIITAKADGTQVTDSMLQSYLNALCKQIRK